MEQSKAKAQVEQNGHGSIELDGINLIINARNFRQKNM